MAGTGVYTARVPMRSASQYWRVHPEITEIAVG